MNFDTFIHYASVALTVYKIFAVVLTIASIAGIVYVAKKSGEMRRVRQEAKILQEKPVDALHTASSLLAFKQLKDNTTQHWRQIVEKLNSQQGEKDYKAIIIEADALVDAALRVNQFPGATMGDRLRSIPAGKIASLEDLWKAHRIRNEIAHDPHYIVSPREGHDMMKVYKKVLEELDAL